jgi:hypothetical protein
MNKERLVAVSAAFREFHVNSSKLGYFRKMIKMVDPEKEERIEVSHASAASPSAPLPRDRSREKQTPPTSESPSSNESSDQPNSIPFSKARCIAIVITVTGASFMNVSKQ